LVIDYEQLLVRLLGIVIMQSDWLSLLLTMKLCLCCLIFCEQATVSSSYPSFPLFLFLQST